MRSGGGHRVNVNIKFNDPRPKCMAAFYCVQIARIYMCVLLGSTALAIWTFLIGQQAINYARCTIDDIRDAFT